jgi:hypothetical protein
MKKHIRQMIDDLQKKNTSDKTPVIDLTPPPVPVLPADLENQILSLNPEERLRQLDLQAQRLDEKGTS